MPHPAHQLPHGALLTGEFARTDTPAQIAARHLGPDGRCYGSMTAYHGRTPGHLTVKNANVCTREHGKIWWGDCDVTVMVEELRALARELGVVVYVLPEMAARFQTAETPEFDRARYETDGTDTELPTQAWATARSDARQRAIETTPGRLTAWYTLEGYRFTLVDEAGVVQPISVAEAKAEFERRGLPWEERFEA